jgi:hypothetical protein
MKKKIQYKKKSTHAAKSILRLPDLEVAKNAVISGLSCLDAQRGYRHAIDEFVEWYCSEPRLSFSKTVVIRLRQEQSPCALVRYAALHTRRRTADFSAPIWQRESAASKALRSLESGWGIG